MVKSKKYVNKINKVIISEKAISDVSRALRSGILSHPEGARYVKLFQKKIGELIEKKYCFATTSGTSSLHASIALLNLKRDDEILVPAMTFMADASVILQGNAKPVFVDIEDKSFNMDLNDLEQKITKKSKAIIAVHLFGQPINMDKLIKIAKKNNIIIIEDCAQALGAKYKGRTVGSFGDISCFSFYQTKHLVAGEGGLIAVNRADYSEKLKSLLNNGIKRSNLENYDFDRIGFNYQMTEMQAVILLDQLKRINVLNKIRRRNASIYKKILRASGIKFQEEIKNSENVYYSLTGLLPKKFVRKRDLFIKSLKKNGIPVKKQYPLALTETELIKKLYGDLSKTTPVACDFAKRVVNFYVNPGLTINDVKYFSNQILKTYLKLQ